MHRVRKAAAFIKFNMPFGTSWNAPVLTDAEAYDLAAFINDDELHPRKMYDLSRDYPNIADKPIDYPFGPYADPFSEQQHKFGPFLPIIDWWKQNRN
jgi:thiosulfate dehydrogenase